MDTPHRITTTGVVHGTTIILADNPGFADGMKVQVIVVPTLPKRPWGEGIIASAGALADDWTEEDDRILEQIYQNRKRSTRQLPE